MRRSEINSPGLAALGNIYLRIGDSGIAISEEPEWDVLVEESDWILKIVRRKYSDAILDRAALAIAKLIYASNHLRGEANARNASAIHNEKARAAKKRKTDQRWKIIRCAIVWVCRKQKLALSASDCFAESIRNDVIEAAKRFGLTDLRSGTSMRSVQRHIAALLKDRRLLNTILGSEELQELF